LLDRLDDFATRLWSLRQSGIDVYEDIYVHAKIMLVDDSGQPSDRAALRTGRSSAIRIERNVLGRSRHRSCVAISWRNISAKI
jgi:hypothetical protein